LFFTTFSQAVRPSQPDVVDSLNADGAGSTMHQLVTVHLFTVFSLLGRVIIIIIIVVIIIIKTSFTSHELN